MSRNSLDNMEGTQVFREGDAAAAPADRGPIDTALAAFAAGAAGVIMPVAALPIAAFAFAMHQRYQFEQLKIFRNYCVIHALLSEWLHVFFETSKDPIGSVPSESIQKTWLIFPVIGFSALLTLTAELLNYWHSKKYPDRSPAAEQAFFSLCSGTLVFFVMQVFLGTQNIPFWSFAAISTICFGSFVRKCLSMHSDEKYLSFDEFDRLERPVYPEATVTECLINAARMGTRAVISISALLATVSREINGETKPLALWQLLTVGNFFLLAAYKGYRLTRSPKELDFVWVRPLAALEQGALTYRTMSAYCFSLVVYACNDRTFCATELERQLLTAFCVLVSGYFAKFGAARAHANFVQLHDSNLTAIEAVRTAPQTINNLFWSAVSKVGSGARYVKNNVVRCCSTDERAAESLLFVP